MISLQKITTEETYIVRHSVLRKGKTIESCHFIGDELATTMHFGVYFKSKLVGIVSLFENTMSTFTDKKQLQIRGMAVLDNYQNLGYGQALIRQCEKIAQEKKTELLWFNARINACGFYEKMGYKKLGHSFEIPEVGEHFLMFKKNILRDKL